MLPFKQASGGFVLLSSLILLLAAATALVMFLVLGQTAVVKAQRGYDTAIVLNNIYQAIVGSPANGSFGYLGDVGQFPSNLLDLVRAPTDSSGNALPGWNGPYLTNPSLVNNQLMDPYGNPVEYFQSTTANSTLLALISKGPDHSSTNTAANPNVASQYTGTLPLDATYWTGVNADNIAIPYFTNQIAALTYIPTGTLAYILSNYDQNNAVKAVVPACPNLYSLTITSVPRGSSSSQTVSFSPGTTVQLVQGLYDVQITSQVEVGPVWTERVAIFPRTTTNRRLQVFPINSSNGQINAFLLNVMNSSNSNLDIDEFTNKIGTVNAGQGIAFSSVEACSRINVYPAGKTTPTVTSFVMPFNNYSVTIQPSFFTLTVTNTGAAGADDAKVYANGVQIGTANHAKTTSFTNVFAGSAITMIDGSGNTVASFTMPTSDYSITIT